MLIAGLIAAALLVVGCIFVSFIEWGGAAVHDAMRARLRRGPRADISEVP